MSDWKAYYRAQNVYEALGAEAGLAGKRREDCPYDKDANPDGLNFWVYGCENAAGEKTIIERGVVEFYSADTGALLFALPVREAIEDGKWAPKWAKLV